MITVNFRQASVVAVFIVLCTTACKENNNKTYPLTIDSIAGNEDVRRYLKSFKGRGELSIDSSMPTQPADALAGFRYPNDLSMDLVLSEPAIKQPVEISFDHRGRLWVVQYNQYPYPKGLKITGVDNYLRVTFDKVPAPPPNAAEGADKISFFEDTDGDGKFDKATDAITGLNITTSVALGRGNIWVLNPPYLLAYPDPDDNGIPNGPPVVHLNGFGLQDTHAVANSLTWGPDGWLYGAQGSTTTSTVSSSITKNLFLQGQAVWRYHPASHVLERFAEGGGNNPFNIEIDEKGRLYSGSNGTDRGPYYKQGGYYIKSWGKHGPLSNPYAFGYLPNMGFDGEKKRFTHAFIKYEGNSLPARYHNKIIALNPYLNYVLMARLDTLGSSFRSSDEEHLLETNDEWFRPVDIQSGPDGAIYLADWYDSRLTHIDPRDNWDKASGRIYRLRNKNSAPSFPKFDLGNYSNDQLIELLADKNEWFRKQSLLLIGNRRDNSIVPKLESILNSNDGQLALEALWAINASGGFNEMIAVEGLHHIDPFVRMWAIRLLGDANIVSPAILQEIMLMAGKEKHPEVLSQLASTAKRLPGTAAVSIIKILLKNHDNSNDPDIPMLIWWALESKAETDRKAVLSIFDDRTIWHSRTVQQVILKNLMQRYIMAGGTENFNAAARLLKLAPGLKLSSILISGLQEGLHGREVTELSRDLLKELKPFQAEFEEAPLSLALRQGETRAVNQALAIIADKTSRMSYRLSYLKIMGETDQPAAVPVLLKLLETNTGDVTQSASELRRSALKALQRYDIAEIGTRVLKAYPMFRSDLYDRTAALELLATRARWTNELLREIVQTKLISKEDVPEANARLFKLLDDTAINKEVDRLWPDTRLLTSTEKTSAINRITGILKSGSGNKATGHTLFLSTCGGCHRLNGEGGNIGPDLSAYNRNDFHTLLTNIVDPNADIREGFEVQILITVDGRTLEGRITARNGGSITFRPPLGGKEITLPATHIKEVRSRQGSIMPERLLDKMSEQEIRDIFSYIKSEP